MSALGGTIGRPRVAGWVAAELWGVASRLPWRRSILLKPYRAIYISVPKVACTSFKTAFARLLGLNLDRARGDPHRVWYPTPVPIGSLQRLLYPGFFRFAFVRNPWDRLVSCYRDKIRNEVDGHTYFTIRPGVANCLARFDAFVADMSFDDFVGRYERLADDFRIVQQRTGLPDIELPRLQAARTAARYAAYYTPRTRDIVAGRFGRDIEMFGYEFGA